MFAPKLHGSDFFFFSQGIWLTVCFFHRTRSRRINTRKILTMWLQKRNHRIKWQYTQNCIQNINAEEKSRCAKCCSDMKMLFCDCRKTQNGCRTSWCSEWWPRSSVKHVLLTLWVVDRTSSSSSTEGPRQVCFACMPIGNTLLSVTLLSATFLSVTHSSCQ